MLLLRFPSHNILQHEFHLRSRINIPTRKKKITYYKGDQQRKPTHDNYDNYDKTHTRYKKMEDNQKLDPQTATLLNRWKRQTVVVPWGWVLQHVRLPEKNRKQARVFLLFYICDRLGISWVHPRVSYVDRDVAGKTNTSAVCCGQPVYWYLQKGEVRTYFSFVSARLSCQLRRRFSDAGPELSLFIWPTPDIGLKHALQACWGWSLLHTSLSRIAKVTFKTQKHCRKANETRNIRNSNNSNAWGYRTTIVHNSIHSDAITVKRDVDGDG